MDAVESSGDGLRTILQGTIVRVAAPQNICPEDEPLFHVASQYTIDQACLSKLRDVTVAGRGPIRYQDAYRPECFAANDGLEDFYRRKKHWRTSLERLVHRVYQIDEPAAWITDDWSCGYFHWICDTLPRLLVIERAQPLDQLTLLLPFKSVRFPFIEESLQAFGLRKTQVLKRFESARCKSLLLPQHVGRTGYHHPKLMSELRQRFWNHVGVAPTTTNPTRRVYLSRGQANLRKMRNESDLLPVLRKHGFECIVAEQLSWLDQVKLFSEVSHLVSPHGAGLTNMIMMPPGNRVMEIRDDVLPTPDCYVTLASASEQEYFYALSQRVDDRKSVHAADMRIDPAILDRSLDRMVRG